MIRASYSLRFWSIGLKRSIILKEQIRIMRSLNIQVNNTKLQNGLILRAKPSKFSEFFCSSHLISGFTQQLENTQVRRHSDKASSSTSVKTVLLWDSKIPRFSSILLLGNN